ncbi:hypothetical protein [Klebsiella grimontii]|uniref:hypothetical protein n=1 Tax=Klebsiella grimontii TaxID=2058152 RepID=UPI0004A12DA4|nr:hypothetical protein [Klebsiella grimontii]KDE91892.1 hypothetical protein DF40_009670 [Stenotrophomonas maltophilia M30]MBZ7653107.1 hypothetical protein [Klebsiella grimontii]HBW7855296.1 hypothetical protein [Klebsiella pneumoniae]
MAAHAKARMHKGVALMLGTATDAHFDELNMVSLLTMSAMIGPIQALKRMCLLNPHRLCAHIYAG